VAVRIAIAVFEGAEELDFAGPWEVLAAWHFLYPDDVEVAPARSSTPMPACSTDGRQPHTGARSTNCCRSAATSHRAPDDRFVDSGEVITAAGVSAGIDMALHLVGRLGSPEKAREVRRYIQYDPQPPY
jgi:putative intracellular protease/amidase